MMCTPLNDVVDINFIMANKITLKDQEVVTALAAKASQNKTIKPATNVNDDANKKIKSKLKRKHLVNTLDRWFKPAKDKKISEKLQDSVTAMSITDNEKPVMEKKPKVKGSSRNFVQHYIHITDECRVCESAKTKEATRCDLRCATCSMTLHKKCYKVRGELPAGDWHCRRCQFIYDATAWEDISDLVGVAIPEGVTFPMCKPLDEQQKLYKLHTDCNFAAVFLFLQRFRSLGLKLSNVAVTLENLGNALLQPKVNGLCAELHTRLLTNIIPGMSKQYPWYVHLLRFLREAEYPPAIVKGTEFPSSSSEVEKCEDFYSKLSLAERVAILKFLCETQFDRNDALVEQIDDEEAESMRNEPIGVDAAGRSYFILEDVATVPNAAVWVCRCMKVGGTDWETVCNDLDTVELLVRQLSLSVESADLQLWQTLSRGVLKKLTRQKERRTRNERWKHELAAGGGLDGSSSHFEGIGRRSLRNRQQVNYASVDAEKEEEEIVADSDNSGNDEDDVFEGKSDNDVDSETDGDGKDKDQTWRSTGKNKAHTKRRDIEHKVTRSSKRIRHSPHENSHVDLRHRSRNHSHAMTISSSHDSDNDDSSNDDSDNYDNSNNS